MWDVLLGCSPPPKFYFEYVCCESIMSCLIRFVLLRPVTFKSGLVPFTSARICSLYFLSTQLVFDNFQQTHLSIVTSPLLYIFLFFHVSHSRVNMLHTNFVANLLLNAMLSWWFISNYFLFLDTCLARAWSV